MSWQIDDGTLQGKTPYSGQCRTGNRCVRADPVDLAGDHERLRIRGISGKEDSDVAVFDEHRQMVGRVTRGCNRYDVPGFRQPLTRRERAERSVVEIDRDRPEPSRPALGQVSTDHPDQPLRLLEF